MDKWECPPGTLSPQGSWPLARRSQQPSALINGASQCLQGRCQGGGVGLVSASAPPLPHSQPGYPWELRTVSPSRMDPVCVWDVLGTPRLPSRARDGSGGQGPQQGRVQAPAQPSSKAVQACSSARAPGGRGVRAGPGREPRTTAPHRARRTRARIASGGGVLAAGVAEHRVPLPRAARPSQAGLGGCAPHPHPAPHGGRPQWRGPRRPRSPARPFPAEGPEGAVLGTPQALASSAPPRRRHRPGRPPDRDPRLFCSGMARGQRHPDPSPPAGPWICRALQRQRSARCRTPPRVGVRCCSLAGVGMWAGPGSARSRHLLGCPAVAGVCRGSTARTHLPFQLHRSLEYCAPTPPSSTARRAASSAASGRPGAGDSSRRGVARPPTARAASGMLRSRPPSGPAPPGQTRARGRLGAGGHGARSPPIPARAAAAGTARAPRPQPPPPSPDWRGRGSAHPAPPGRPAPARALRPGGLALPGPAPGPAPAPRLASALAGLAGNDALAPHWGIRSTPARVRNLQVRGQ